MAEVISNKLSVEVLPQQQQLVPGDQLGNYPIFCCSQEDDSFADNEHLFSFLCVENPPSPRPVGFRTVTRYFPSSPALLD
mmetsp:Transcript_13836/g.18481  ORF Transcript_13836/g.18481 Transcript_13836/m.18481 type:complete len:80 (+) Transcript_13836:55-294(+)